RPVGRATASQRWPDAAPIRARRPRGEFGRYPRVRDRWPRQQKTFPQPGVPGSRDWITAAVQLSRAHITPTARWHANRKTMVIIRMATNVATGLEIEGEDHIRPVTWDDTLKRKRVERLVQRGFGGSEFLCFGAGNSG